MYERVMEVGIGRNSDGTCFLTSKHPSFCEKYGDRISDIPARLLYDRMDDLAVWANNVVKIGIMFYMY